jgi:hypothetical protein
MSTKEVYLTREEIEHPYANLAVMLEDKRKKAEQMSNTVFHHITASPEVLAEKFIGLIFDHRFTSKYRYYSMLTGEFYNSREEAHAATVAKLKEVGE